MYAASLSRHIPTLLLCLGLATPSGVRAQEEPLSDRRVSYVMDVRLDPDQRSVTGRQRVTWRNPANEPVDELQFHLYMNAFSGPNSTFMKESGGVHRGFEAGENDPWGGIDIERMVRIDASSTGDAESETDLTSDIRFIQPDDGNLDDRTVIQVDLDEAVAVGDSIVLDIDFTTRLPEIVARTGWKRGESGRPFFMVAQWFPKLGVYEVPGQRYVPEDAESGAWSTHQFHANSEFYADFGTYDVTISVPDDHVVGASGIRVDESVAGGKKTQRYVARDVHDFAWTASPDFLEFSRTWNHVQMRVLLQPAHRHQADRHFEATIIALERFADWVGPYPYTTLTIVDGIGGANGMEYPTLITAGTWYALPSWVRLLELVTIHEFGHQYFYGILASNEAEEAWLDEGINSYVETRIMSDVWGNGSAIDLGPIDIGDREAQRLAYVKSNPERGALYTRSWDYRWGDYSKASYSKPATVLTTLERHLGWETMHRILRSYYDTWAFRHPTTRDFQAVAEDVSGEDLSWFFDQFVYGTAVVDYQLDRLTYRRIENTDTTLYRTTVRVHRAEDGVFPQTVRAVFADGTSQDRRWDGEDEWREFTFESATRPERAIVDPAFTVFLDVNRLNNGRSTSLADSGGIVARTRFRGAALLQRIFFILGGLF
ncbi:MAG: M1 family metallopeptidase [Rhodothermales bacterium]|nr:M1 family metallopeptidase [Rhodothermales bacterium]